MTAPPPDIPRFPIFVAWWNRLQGRTTPSVHLKVALWLETMWLEEQTRLLLMAFRGCGKSTLMGLFGAWILARDPSLRILVVSADDHLGARMVRHVRKIIEQHPVCRPLVPRDPDQWAADRFTVARPFEGRDPSMVTAGITGNITGMRADVIICDDVEVPNTADTAEKRDDLRLRLRELNFVQAANARMIYVGTPHALQTIYATDHTHEVNAEPPFLQGYQALRVPVMDQAGVPAWPEKYNAETLDDLRRITGAAMFSSQMMLTPTQLEAPTLDPQALRVIDDQPFWHDGIDRAWIGDRAVAHIRAWWDPALATGTGDQSVLAVVMNDTNGHSVIVNMTYLRVDDAAPADNATQQCDQVAAVLAQYRVPVIGLEINGLGRLLPGLLRHAIVRAGARTKVVEHSQKTAKNVRIMTALATRLAARMVMVHRSVLATPFIDELRDFRASARTNRDDGLDAVAGALSMLPIKIPTQGDHNGR
jgi:hypothetical protein